MCCWYPSGTPNPLRCAPSVHRLPARVRAMLRWSNGISRVEDVPLLAAQASVRQVVAIGGLGELKPGSRDQGRRADAKRRTLRPGVVVEPRRHPEPPEIFVDRVAEKHPPGAQGLGFVLDGPKVRGELRRPILSRTAGHWTSARGSRFCLELASRRAAPAFARCQRRSYAAGCITLEQVAAEVGRIRPSDRPPTVRRRLGQLVATFVGALTASASAGRDD